MCLKCNAPSTSTTRHAPELTINGPVGAGSRAMIRPAARPTCAARPARMVVVRSDIGKDVSRAATDAKDAVVRSRPLFFFAICDTSCVSLVSRCPISPYIISLLEACCSCAAIACVLNMQESRWFATIKKTTSHMHSCTRSADPSRSRCLRHWWS